jgi:hypothetical protein
VTTEIGDDLQSVLSKQRLQNEQDGPIKELNPVEQINIELNDFVGVVSGLIGRPHEASCLFTGPEVSPIRAKAFVEYGVECLGFADLLQDWRLPNTLSQFGH